MPDDIRKKLSKALSKLNATYADAVATDTSDVDPYPAPFLKQHKIYLVVSYPPNPQIGYYVGYAPGEKEAHILTGSPEAYVSMAKEDGVTIDSPEKAAEYVKAALEVTRSMSGLVYVAESVDGVRFQGNLDDDEEKLKKAFKEKYRSRIKPPYAEPAGDGYHVTAFVVENDIVYRHSVIVSKEGDMKSEVTKLEEGLPLMMGM